VQQPNTDFVPEMKKYGRDRVIIGHMLQMTSGMAFTENYYSPFSSAVRFYCGRHLVRYALKLKLNGEPGGKWEYVRGDTQLLGILLQRAMRAKGDQRSVTQYRHDRIWGPLGMEYSSSWSMDRKSDGIEKAFCCIYTPVRPFAKLGSLYLRNSSWRGQQLVPEQWVRTSTVASTEHNGASWYRCQRWLPTNEGDLVAVGFRGQYIYADLKRDLMMVRVSSSKAGLDRVGVFRSLAHGYE
jgi:CubicO group peptidase (beta-lactamase class C family)